MLCVVGVMSLRCSSARGKAHNKYEQTVAKDTITRGANPTRPLILVADCVRSRAWPASASSTAACSGPRTGTPLTSSTMSPTATRPNTCECAATSSMTVEPSSDRPRCTPSLAPGSLSTSTMRSAMDARWSRGGHGSSMCARVRVRRAPLTSRELRKSAGFSSLLYGFIQSQRLRSLFVWATSLITTSCIISSCLCSRVAHQSSHDSTDCEVFTLPRSSPHGNSEGTSRNAVPVTVRSVV
eukprot:7382687-Prymnesium_polylepis.3